VPSLTAEEKEATGPISHQIDPAAAADQIAAHCVGWEHPTCHSRCKELDQTNSGFNSRTPY
jgi:hypothetical protein